MPKVVAAAILSFVLLAADPAYQAGIEKWRRAREESLTKDGGWLTVSGLFWLHEGSNPFGSDPKNEIVLRPPAQAGVFEFHQGKVILRMGGKVRELRPDTSGSPDTVALGDLTLLVIQRGDRYGIRLKDNHSKLRREFTGLHFFPVKDSYRITTRFIPLPQTIAIPNVLGQTEPLPSPGYAEFRLEGRDLRLYPVLEEPDAKELLFIFRDLTSGKETYGAGRFLYTDLPENGKVILDFNKAYNPPCAFTPYATCPLPPRQNRLPVRIEAGELNYRHP